jgi:pimeloyl-ACP methyl ester carboxylesterase
MSIDGRSLYYEVHGTGDPILLIHGFPLSGELWKPFVPALEEEFRLIIPDLRGHGRSQASARVTMAGFADDLATLLEKIGETLPVVLVGMSMGGYISFEFYRRHRERVHALVLANTRAQADNPGDAQLRREMVRLAKRKGSVTIAEAMMPRLFGPRAPVELRTRWIEIMAATKPEGIVAALEVMAQRPDSFPTLASIICPILIITGEDDTLTPPGDAKRMQQAANARLEILSGAGHMSPVERPGTFIEVLRRFLNELPRQDGV